MLKKKIYKIKNWEKVYKNSFIKQRTGKNYEKVILQNK